MIRTKAMLVSAAAAACLAGVAASSIGAAAAATSTTSTSTTTSPATTAPTTTPATITVNGAAIVTVDPSADVATQNAGYLGALGSAVTNAQTKATALATQVGDTLAAVQNITEQSSYSGGDFCGNRVFVGAATSKGSAPAAGPAVGSHKKKPHPSSKPKATARIADVVAPTTCSIEADVTVTYAMAPA
jgi:uncharacterized protein YggE